MLDTLKRFLLSRKTVISLICALGIFCVVGSLVPQLAERPPQFFAAWKADSPKIYYLVDLLQLNHVFTSVWFFILVALVTLSLSFSMYYQAKALMKSGSAIRKEITEKAFKDYLTLEAEQNSAVEAWKQDELVETVFRDRGYRPYQASEGSRYFVFGKNRIGRWGGVVFHAGLIVIIIAGLYGLAFQKRGFVQLIQEDTFQGKDEEWNTKKLGFLAKDFNPGFRLYLDRFIPLYWESGMVKDLESNLIITDDKGESREFSLSLGGPVEFKGVNIYQSEYYGYTIGFMLERERENPVITNFSLDAPVKKNKPFTGRNDFPTTGYIFEMKFYPDLVAYSPYAKYPGVDLVVTEKGGQRFKGTVLLNQRVRLGSDTLTFAQIHYWTGLILTSNYAMPVVYSGFTLSTLGAIMIFMLSYKEIHVKITEGEGRIRLSMGGRSKSDQAIFSEEFREIGEMIRKVLGEYGNYSIT